jgi:hypothetical protein
MLRLRLGTMQLEQGIGGVQMTRFCARPRFGGPVRRSTLAPARHCKASWSAHDAAMANGGWDLQSAPRKYPVRGNCRQGCAVLPDFNCKTLRRIQIVLRGDVIVRPAAGAASECSQASGGMSRPQAAAIWGVASACVIEVVLGPPAPRL